MKTRFFLPFCFLILNSFQLSGQQLSEYIFGTSDWNNVIRLWEAPDGNLNVMTTASDGTPNGSAYVLYRLTPHGQEIWQKTFSACCSSVYVEPEEDGSFWLGTLAAGGYQLTRYDSEGEPLNSFTYSHPDLWDDWQFSIRRTPDKQHFVLAFKDHDPPMGIRVVKLSLTGAVVFNKFIGAPDPFFDPLFFPPHLAVLSNGRVVVAVYDFSYGYGFYCFSPAGTQLWISNMYQAPDFPEECGIIPLANGNFVFRVEDGDDDGHAVCISNTGSLLWQKKLTEVIPKFRPYTGFADGNDVVLAGDGFFPGGIGLGVVKLNAAGEVIFDKTFPLLNGDYDIAAAKTVNGDYVFSGFKWECCYHNANAYFLSLQPGGQVNWLLEGTEELVNNIGTFYHASNGDHWMGGNLKVQSAPQSRHNFLMKVSGLPPALPQMAQGRVAQDDSGNCAVEGNEPGLSLFIVKAEAGGMTRYATTDTLGNYRIRLPDADSVVLEVFTPNGLFEPCQSSFEVAFGNSDTVLHNLPIDVLAQCPVLTLDGGAAFLRRCFDNTYFFQWCNSGNTIAENSILSVELDSFMSYVSSSLPLAGQNGQTLSFNSGNLSPGSCGQLLLRIHLSCDASLGQTHCMEANLLADNTCPAYQGNLSAASDCQPNIGSFDPNDIRAFVNDTIWEGDISPNTDIEYQVRFENTGTDTAFNIVIIDTLPPTLDPGTLRMGTASHPCSWEITEGQLLKIKFADIHLPHSSINPEGSQGFVQFRLSQKKNLPGGTKILSRAAIFFDFNEAIVTNLHELVVKLSTGVKETGQNNFPVSVYPNPSHDGRVWIEAGDLSKPLSLVQVFDLRGVLVKSLKANQFQSSIELPETPGLYFFKIFSSRGDVTIVKVVRS